MKLHMVVLTAVILLAVNAFAQTYVNGYTRRDGTYVQPHYRSSPDNTTANNYSTKGNVNPYTGAIGTRNPDPISTQNNNTSFGSSFDNKTSQKKNGFGGF